jgi:alpha-L-fucosidase
MFGDGPTKLTAGMMNEGKAGTFTPDDVRFTTKGGTLFMAMLKWPDRPVAVPALRGTRIARATLVGSGPVTMTAGAAGPSFTLPPAGAGDIVPVVALEGPGLV